MRTVVQTFRAHEAPVGDFSVLRALPQSKCRHVGPFVFLDHFGPTVAKDGPGITKETPMSILNQIRDAMAKRAVYVRTRNEIRAMPRDVAHDIGLFPEDAEQIAWTAVYG